MCWKILTFCMFLLIVSSLALQPSSTNDDNKDNLTVREFDEDTKRNYDKKAELRKNYTNDNEDNYVQVKIKIIKSQLLNHIIPHEICDNITYIHILCCPFNNCLVHKNCIAEENEFVFSNVYNYSNDSMQNENKKVDEFCPMIVENPRQRNIYSHNGTIYPYFEFIQLTIYCLMDDDQFNASICLKAMNETFSEEMDKIGKDLANEFLSIDLTILFYSNIVSMLCLFLIFLVYSILPELCNIHSFMLRRVISLAFIAHTIVLIDYLFNVKDLTYSICLISALIKYFCNLTSDFWLSVMSCDMWWTFRDLWSLQKKGKKQQERKKFIYSTIAWGGPFILTIICIMMDFVPGVPKNLIQPEFGINKCWFHTNEAYWLYFLGPQGISVISSTCLSIYTALKIMRYEKDTTHHMENSERQSFNNNRQWFNLYLKLFIVVFIMTAIKWILIIIWEFWLINNVTKRYIHHIIFLMVPVQYIVTFIIFVCKKKIMQLLLKHFGQNHGSILKCSR
ncbi:G-protein coupled receptor Mth-like [Formica exsecta]|uniref:G-protein coupled receptor Mth-like n=1 Tax=Formica exsecta TaxID=72781 RepID=UPI00114327C6|nr:G-protein coupled receptor Mth-like [Formica exsecta]